MALKVVYLTVLVLEQTSTDVVQQTALGSSAEGKVCDQRASTTCVFCIVGRILLDRCSRSLTNNPVHRAISMLHKFVMIPSSLCNRKPGEVQQREFTSESTQY